VISKLDSVDAYISKSHDLDESFTDKADVMMSLYNDLFHFVPNVQKIATMISETYKLLQEIVKRFEDNTNGLYQSQGRLNELLSFLNGFDKTFRDIVLSVSKNMINRLNNISSVVEDINAALPIIPIDQQEFILSESVDYFSLFIENFLNELEQEKESTFINMHKEYVSLRNKRDRGVKTIFEAGKSTDAKKKNILEEKQTQFNEGFSNFIDSITEIFDKKVEERVSKNNEWLSANKGKLSSIDTNEIQFRVSPYENVTEKTILSYISTVITNINNINQARFNSFASRDELNRYLFPFVPETIGEVKELSGKLRLVLTVGKTGDTGSIKYI
jgi:hypothetical protein